MTRSPWGRHHVITTSNPRSRTGHRGIVDADRRMRRGRHRAGRDDARHLVEHRRRSGSTDPHRTRDPVRGRAPAAQPLATPRRLCARPDQRRVVDILIDLSTGNDGEELAQRSTCRVLDGIQSPPADAPAWQARIVATVTMRHGYALLAAPRQRSADAAVVVLARILDDVDALAGQPYRPVFVQGCSPY